jgi:hypothetical protein
MTWMSVRSWFDRRPDVSLPVVDAPDKLEAYKEGRRDERGRSDPGVDAAPRLTKADLDAAYDRGRLDGRRRRGSPLVGFLTLLLVVVGAGILYLAVRNGSFGKGGEVVDRNVSAAAEKVQAPLRGAADRAGTALQNAGESIKDRAGTGQP